MQISYAPASPSRLPLTNPVTSNVDQSLGRTSLQDYRWLESGSYGSRKLKMSQVSLSASCFLERGPTFLLPSSPSLEAPLPQRLDTKEPGLARVGENRVTPITPALSAATAPRTYKPTPECQNPKALPQ